ncbi:hypothetical protein BOSEA1005_12604 [Hyphomicrobiales bacterium]|nr:hypothetical protein BOSEA1005_12604 [Hyphomicrobiales bacterium]
MRATFPQPDHRQAAILQGISGGLTLDRGHAAPSAAAESGAGFWLNTQQPRKSSPKPIHVRNGQYDRCQPAPRRYGNVARGRVVESTGPYHRGPRLRLSRPWRAQPSGRAQAARYPQGGRLHLMGWIPPAFRPPWLPDQKEESDDNSVAGNRSWQAVASLALDRYGPVVILLMVGRVKLDAAVAKLCRPAQLRGGIQFSPRACLPVITSR